MTETETSQQLFTSPRERRLWGWTLALVVAIYATLGIAGSLAGMLRNRGLLDQTFFAAFLVILVAIVVHGLRVRPGGIELMAWLGVFAAYVMVLLRTAIPEERSHLIEYSVVALLIHSALLERRDQGRPVRFPGLTAIAATSAIGILDEGIQLLLPNRVFDPVDILFNVLAAVMAVTGASVIAAARGQFRPGAFTRRS